MALLTQKNVGGITTNPAVATLAEDSLQIDNTYVTDALAVPGLPKIIFWCRFYGGDGAPIPTLSAAVSFEVAVRTENGEPKFTTFNHVIVPPVNGISYSFDFPCLAIRASFGVPVVGTLVNLDYSLNAYGS